MKFENNWKKYKLIELCEFVYGDSLPKHKRNKGNVPVYGSNGQIDFHNKSLTNCETIIVGRKGSIGEVHFSNIGCWVIDTAYYIKPLIEYDTKFFLFLLKVLNLPKLNKASAIPGLNRADVYKIEVALPPLDKQKRIVKIIEAKLNAVETMKRASSEQNNILEILKTSHFRYLHNKYSKQWEKIKLKEICTFINGDAYKDTDWDIKGVPIVRIQNLNNVNKPFNYWQGSLNNRITIDNSDLLLAWSGTPGTSFGAHIWNRGFALLNQHIFKVIYNIDKADIYFLKCAINQILDVMIEKSHGAVGLRHVTKGVVEDLEIFLPTLNEQKRIVKIIETKLNVIEKVKKASDEQSSCINALQSSILRKAFNGEY